MLNVIRCIRYGNANRKMVKINDITSKNDLHSSIRISDDLPLKKCVPNEQSLALHLLGLQPLVVQIEPLLIRLNLTHGVIFRDRNADFPVSSRNDNRNRIAHFTFSPMAGTVTRSSKCFFRSSYSQEKEVIVQLY